MLDILDHGNGAIRKISQVIILSQLNYYPGQSTDVRTQEYIICFLKKSHEMSKHYTCLGNQQNKEITGHVLDKVQLATYCRRKSSYIMVSEFWMHKAADQDASVPALSLFNISEESLS